MRNVHAAATRSPRPLASNEGSDVGIDVGAGAAFIGNINFFDGSGPKIFIQKVDFWDPGPNWTKMFEQCSKLIEILLL